jgi:hypothetical protein
MAITTYRHGAPLLLRSNSAELRKILEKIPLPDESR